MSKSRALIVWTVVVSIVCLFPGFPGSVYAQCNPPGPNTKCWDGGGVGSLWSDRDNWNPDGVPQDLHDVYHLIGGVIVMDMGTFHEPAPINSFTFDPTGLEALILEPDRALSVAGDFVSTDPFGPDLYSLVLQANSNLVVGGDINGVDAILLEPLLGGTSMSVNGHIGPGNWRLEPNTIVFANFDVDLTGAPAGASTWDILGGHLNVSGAVLGNGRFTVDVTNGRRGRLEVFSSFKAASLVAKGGLTVMVGLFLAPHVLHIKEQLVADASVVEQWYGTLLADQGSVIVMKGGGVVNPHKFGSFGFNVVGSVEYGVPATFPNRFINVAGLQLAYADSSIRKAEGPDSELNLEIFAGDLAIFSEIHGAAADWDSSGVNLQFTPGFYPTALEAIAPDFDGIWFADSPCIKAWGSLEVGEVLPLTLEDTWENSNPVVNQGTQRPEAVYVDGDVSLQGGVPLDMYSINLYYTGTVWPRLCAPGHPGCPTFVVKTLYGDFDGDGGVSLPDPYPDPDVVRFNAAYPSPYDPYDPLVDLNCDGDVDVDDRARFIENWCQLPECQGWGDLGLESECGGVNALCEDGAGACSFDCCDDQGCTNIPALYGDLVAGDFCGAGCGPDGTINIFDLLAVLNGFGGVFPGNCELHNFDIQPCQGNGTIDIFDYLAVLGAFQGIDPCCGGGSGGESSTMGSDPSFTSAGVADITLVAVGQASMEATDAVTVDVYAGSVIDLQGYQLAIESTGGESGTLVLERLYIDAGRDDYVFAALESLTAVDQPNGRMLSVLMEGSVAPQGQGYLGTYIFRPSPDARGTFDIALSLSEETILVDSLAQPITIRSASATTISVR